MSDQAPIDPGNPLGTQAMSAVRSAVMGGIAYAVGKGWFDAATGSQLASAALILIPLAISQYAAFMKRRKLVAATAMAQAR